MFEIFSKDEDRGQVGIGTLIVFIAMVLVAAIAAGVLINTAGFLQSQSEETGQQSSQQVTNRLDIVAKTGVVTNDAPDDVTIGQVDLTVTKAPGAQDIDLEDVTIQWISDANTYDIVSQDADTNGQGTNDGVFTITAVKDEDGSATIVNSPDDRMRLTLDLSTIGTNNAFLAEGDSVTLRIATEDGSASTVRLTVPQSLSGQTAATL
ncbi:archaellin/type IV pilin N-terminal domain-containing protein [Halorientalis pallida]|uniref:Flagellin n=1 Tax=Halorientalis pallida TaxID=2479928 RepID=A0A498KUQ9_9EURY|nr:archaellin/type IV pilin N-terminal domain-containing protein [Halorientalis pallida]RXK47249.1 flagellin [Halorientalis pallida]